MEEGVFFVFLFKKRGGREFYHIDSSEVCLKHRHPASRQVQTQCSYCNSFMTCHQMDGRGSIRCDCATL